MPPYLRLVPASACWNASKISRCFSGAMPMPVSLTSMATTRLRESRTDDPADQPRDADCTRIATWPCAVNLKAFESRFLRICCSRFGSLVKARGSVLSMSTWNGRFFDSAT